MSPVRKIRKRWIAFRVHSDRDVSVKELPTILGKVIEYEGIKKFSIIEYDSSKKVGILLCSHRSLDKMKLALSKVKKATKGQMMIEVIGISGTIRKLRRKFLAHL
jgi:ribonuclease P/MRP protein subunit POP5